MSKFVNVPEYVEDNSYYKDITVEEYLNGSDKRYVVLEKDNDGLFWPYSYDKESLIPCICERERDIEDVVDDYDELHSDNVKVITEKEYLIEYRNMKF